jgi:DHA3 family macrolide efflux protein-like MFS transporter
MEDKKQPVDPPMRPFLVLWSAQALSLLGSQAVQFALIWWLTARTESAAVLAAAAFVGLFPPVVLGPVIGALVDRWSRRAILFFSDFVVAVASGVLAVLFMTGTASTAAVFAILLVRALGAAFHTPTMVASTTLMVPARHLTRIQGLNQAIQGGALILTAPIGALLVSLMPMAGVMALDVVTAAIAIVPLAFVRVPQPPPAVESPDGPKRTGLVGEILEGFGYLRRTPGTMALMGLASTINLFLVPAFSLLPLYVVVELGADAMHLGWMNSLFGIGTLVGGIALGVWGGFRRRIFTAWFGLVGLGAAVAGVGLAPPEILAVSLGAMFAVGATVPFVNGTIQAVLQETVDPAIQGRVFTLAGSLAGIAAPLGLVVAGPLAEVAGVRSWYLVGGAICALMGVAGFLIPSLARFGESAEETTASA